jgi:RNA polymerase sigma-70 factor (ECF subfamily)
MEPKQMVADDMVALMPQMHNFARSLCRDAVRAADLVQEALLRAYSNIERFQPGTNLKAWLFTILRNEHYSQLRRQKFEAVGFDTSTLPEPSVQPDHDGELELRELHNALSTLPTGQRTALLLVSASGLSYEEAAGICGCAVGTIKSRVARAREMLVEMLDGGDAPRRTQRPAHSRRAASRARALPATRHVFHSSLTTAPSL